MPNHQFVLQIPLPAQLLPAFRGETKGICPDAVGNHPKGLFPKQECACGIAAGNPVGCHSRQKQAVHLLQWVFVIQIDAGAVAVGNVAAPVISRWASGWHGLEAVAEPFNVAFGLMVMCLAVSLGALYMINNINHENLAKQLKRSLLICFACFVVLLVYVLVKLLTMEGFAVGSDGVVYMEEYKYLHNFLEMPVVLGMFLVGAVLLVAGVVMTLLKSGFVRGIWLAGPGTVLAVMALFMVAGYNNTAYYPSTYDLQASLTLANSCSSEFTLRTMAVVSLIIPFVVAYIAYFWRQMDKKSLTTEELNEGDKY
jgi:cytochrome d ubiquinol oxidase subunit II